MFLTCTGIPIAVVSCIKTAGLFAPSLNFFGPRARFITSTMIFIIVAVILVIETGLVDTS